MGTPRHDPSHEGIVPENPAQDDFPGVTPRETTGKAALRLDSMILELFSNLNNSQTPGLNTSDEHRDEAAAAAAWEEL